MPPFTIIRQLLTKMLNAVKRNVVFSSKKAEHFFYLYLGCTRYAPACPENWEVLDPQRAAGIAGAVGHQMWVLGTELKCSALLSC